MRIAVSRAREADRVVTPLELFFDLVYVFAIGQLSHHLLEHVDLRTGAETAILTLGVFYAWCMVAWGRTGSTRTGCRCGSCWSG
jgi:low temperature requirement protein LtrA